MASTPVRRSNRRFPLILAVLVVSAQAVLAGDVLIFEDFEKLSLTQLPPGWGLREESELAVVEQPERGKCLRIKARGGSWPHLYVELDPAKVAGKRVRLSALVLLPGEFAAVPGKRWAQPKVQLQLKDKNGADSDAEQTPTQKTPTWQLLQAALNIPEQAQKVTALLRVDLAAAEVWFDNLCVETDPNGPPPQMGAGIAVAPAKVDAPTAAAGAVPPAIAPEKIATADVSHVPSRTLAGSGVLFDGNIAARMQKELAASKALRNSLLIVGPGQPVSEFGKPPRDWALLAEQKPLCGPTTNPRTLLTLLPEALETMRPEIVVLVADTKPGRRAASSEADDWQDVIQLCLRLGAVPLLAISLESTEDGWEELRGPVLEAARNTVCPQLELKMPQTHARRLNEAVRLIEEHVLGRALSGPAGEAELQDE